MWRFIVCRLVRHCLICNVRLVILKYKLQLITDSINDLDVNATDPKHEYSGDLDFIILFVDTLLLHAINLGDVSLFADSPFTFLPTLI